MSALQTHLVVIGFLFCVSNGVAPAAERLPTDYWRQPLAPQGEAPRSWTPEERSLTPESCGACHGDKLEEWRTSLHAKGFSPGLVGQLLTYDAAESAACMQCHAPMAEQREAFEAARHKAESHPFTDRGLADAGNSCGGCHLRSHRHFGPPQRDQGSDGRDPLPNEDVATGCCRDGPARTGLQPHAHHEHRGRPTAAGGDAGIVVAEEPFQKEKVAKHGKMTKHSHSAEIAARRCFCQGVFTQPRPTADVRPSTANGRHGVGPGHRRIAK